MEIKAGLKASFLLFVSIFLFLLEPANATVIVRLGEDRTIYEMKPFDPWAISGDAHVRNNTATVDLLLPPAVYGEGKAYLGPDFELQWNSPYTWNEIKNVPVKITTDFSYEISSNGDGFCGVNIHIRQNSPQSYRDVVQNDARSGDEQAYEEVFLGNLELSNGIHCRGVNISDQEFSLYGEVTVDSVKIEFFQSSEQEIITNLEETLYLFPISIYSHYETIFGSISLFPAPLKSINDTASSGSGLSYFINYGDNSDPELVDNNLFIHAYENIGDYEISLSFPGDFDFDGNVDGSDLIAFIDNPSILNLNVFALYFGESD